LCAYLPILRTKQNPYLKLFNFPEPSNPVAVREASNVPAQALWFMNNPFVLEHAEALAKRAAAHSNSPAERVELVFRLCLTRSPSPDEVDRALRFIGSEPERLTTFCQAVMASAEFRYLN